MTNLEFLGLNCFMHYNSTLKPLCGYTWNCLYPLLPVCLYVPCPKLKPEKSKALLDFMQEKSRDKKNTKIF